MLKNPLLNADMVKQGVITAGKNCRRRSATETVSLVFKLYLLLMIYMCDLKLAVECEHTFFSHLKEFMML